MPSGREGAVLAGGDPRELPELAAEVGLIAVARVERDVGPGRGRIGRQPANHSLEALEATVDLGRDAHRAPEEADEGAMATSRCAHDFPDRLARGEALESQRDRGVEGVHARHTRGEQRLEEIELPLEPARVQVLLPDARGRRAPEVLERPVPAGQLVGGRQQPER